MSETPTAYDHLLLRAEQSVQLAMENRCLEVAEAADAGVGIRYMARLLDRSPNTIQHWRNQGYAARVRRGGGPAEQPSQPGQNG